MSYATRKGEQFRTDIIRYLRSKGFEAEKIALAGALDESDVCLKIGGEPYILELKARATLNLAGWVKEAEEEAVNWGNARSSIAKPYFAVVHKRKQHPIANTYVTLPLHEYLRQLELPF